MAEKQKGVVKWFSAAKGFGFIAIEGQADAFVHYSEIVGDGYRTLEEGQAVEFTVKDSPKGLSAVDVVALVA